MEIPCHQVDAFTTRVFEGNPAAVCPLPAFLDDATLQAIAFENALSETAFVVRRDDGDYDLRWHTPVHEVDLCGHATLATAWVLRHLEGDRRETLRFVSRKSGVLSVRAHGDTFTLDFPSRPPAASSAPPGLLDALGLDASEQREAEVLRSRDLVVVLASSDRVRALTPDLTRIGAYDSLYAVTVTAPGSGRDADVDFVSRFFAPREGVPEDPVTGSAHCTLAPLWAARLGKTVLRATGLAPRRRDDLHAVGRSRAPRGQRGAREEGHLPRTRRALIARTDIRARSVHPLRMRSIVAPLLVLPLWPVLGCEARAPSEDAAALSEDAGLDASASANEDAGPPPPPWPSGLSPLEATRRDFQLRRAIVHLHSPLSHDACDGEGWVDGALADTACFDHLRSAACTLHMDTLWLTDHAPHVEEPGFEAAHWATRPGDELVRSEAGDVIAARWACEDAHRVLVMVGSENEMMPVGLLRHPSLDPAVLADPAQLGAIYDADGREAAAVFREAGALVLYAHTEGHTLEQLRGTQPDGIEIYNTHANVDPNIREEHLGLGRLDYAPMLFRFTNAAHRLEPDLAVLSFLSENDNALSKWDTLLAEGAHVFGTGGCDAHENTFTMEMPDGERGDSYRRMMYWHTHHLLVRGEGRDAMMEALGHGRFYLTFEVLGTPVGFDFVGTDPLGATCEMGDTCPAGTTLRVVRPSLPAGFPSDPPPTLELRILRAADGGAVEVARGTGESLEHVTETVGAYRAEVRIVPEHARPYLGAFADELVREVPWVYSNPIYVDWP